MINTLMMRNILLICMMLLGFSVHAFAQKEIVVTGIVTDTNKEPLIGVNAVSYTHLDVYKRQDLLRPSLY